MTLSEGQGHSDWYKTVEYSAVYHHTMFQRNICISIWTQTKVKGILYKITLVELYPLKWIVWNQFSMNINHLKGDGSMLYFIQNWLWHLQANEHTGFCFLTQSWPWMKVKVNQTGVKM